jgi:hypothetical protein
VKASKKGNTQLQPGSALAQDQRYYRAVKRIPYTLHWIRQYRVPAIQAMWGFFAHDYPALLANPGHAGYPDGT